MSVNLPIDIEIVKGFLHPDEGAVLYACACDIAQKGLCVEIGSYCGKSTVYLGTACKKMGSRLIAVDHHYGSEENQPGEAYCDLDLVDTEMGGMSSLTYFRKTMREADLEKIVIPILAPSALAASIIHQPIALLFIDGGHSMQATFDDYRLWSGKLMVGGMMAIHDVFPNPDDGGRPPYEIYKMAMSSGLFKEIHAVKSLRVLQRL